MSQRDWQAYLVSPSERGCLEPYLGQRASENQYIEREKKRGKKRGKSYAEQGQQENQPWETFSSLTGAEAGAQSPQVHESHALETQSKCHKTTG